MSEAIIAAAEAIHAARPDGDPGCAFMERLRAAPEIEPAAPIVSNNLIRSAPTPDADPFFSCSKALREAEESMAGSCHRF